jgi:erythromycin esterase-like protein
MHKILSLTLLATFIVLSLPGQTLTKDQKKFLKENSVTISADTNFNRADWKVIANQVKNKKIILLGEFNHSSKEVFQTRNSLIKYLHEKLGINVILLESGIGELASTDLKKETLSPAQMTNGLVGSWRTQEFRDLITYVKAQNISIAGFDVQRTGGSFAFLLKETAQKNKIDSIYFYNLEQRYSIARQELSNGKTIYDSVSARTNQLISDYKRMADELKKVSSSQVSTEIKFCIVTLKNRIQFLSYMLAFLKDRDWNKRWAARDSAMAENVEWLREHVYKGQPVIVIAHNFHIARFNDKESVMGEILAARYGKEMYCLGVFAGSGSFQDNFGRPEKMALPDSTGLDVKHIIAGLSGSANFINIPRKSIRGSDWLRIPITVNDTFIDLTGSNKMILANYFDGLLLLDKISPPKN